jgi:predicted metalloendopeptidase
MSARSSTTWRRTPSAYGASGKQVGDFYASWMDEAGIEARGTAPLKPYLATIAGVNDLTGCRCCSPASAMPRRSSWT